MEYNLDLNSNLIKSLTSVHLPPPPSSRASASTSHDLETPLHQVHSYNKHHLQPEVYIAPNSAKDRGATTTMPYKKKKTDSSHELMMAPPLTTPPHTISKSDRRPAKKNKVLQETPTSHQQKLKKSSKNPPSPQYSSPASSVSQVNLVPALSVTKKSAKPPQPAFNTPKNTKKSLVQRPVEEPFELPLPSEMPEVIHDSDEKPPYSYATLIGMAILRGEDRKLTLSQIYSWISSTFRYYRKNDVGWQNSIRHNLSLNKAFVKTEKSLDGKGHFWEIEKGHEKQFVLGKTGKRTFGGVQLDSNSSRISLEGTNLKKADQSISNSVIKSSPDLNKNLLPASSSFHKASDRTSVNPERHRPLLRDSDDSEDEFSEYEASGDEYSKTPQAQIRTTDTDLKERPSLKKSHTAIGLQRITTGETSMKNLYYGKKSTAVSVGDGFYDSDSKVPRKKRQMRSVSTGFGSLKNIPQLEAPDTNWAASASGEHILFGQVKPSSESPKASFVSLPATSSFSCNTNFEMSPLKRQETGPLLEPLTPSSRPSSFATTISTGHVTSLSSQQISKTPLHKSTVNNQNITNGLLNSAQANHFQNFLKTPTAKIRTPNPNSNSILRKFWNSPSMADDFYTSPSIPRYSDDDFPKGLFGSPKKAINKRQQFMENTGSYGFTDLFGVDICSVVRRAVENCNDKGGEDDFTAKGGSTTDEDNDDGF